MIGFTRDAIIIAADSAVYSEGKVVRTDARKIIPIGKFGALLITGFTILSTQMKEIDVYGIATGCANESSEIETAQACLTKRIRAAISPIEDWSKVGEELVVGLYLAGYVKGRRTLKIVEFTVPPGKSSLSFTAEAAHPEVGFVHGFGRTDFAAAALHGKVPQLASSPELKLYRRRDLTHTRSRYTNDEMISLELFLLQKTESPIAAKWDPGNEKVGPPNHVVLIDSVQGVQWRF